MTPNIEIPLRDSLCPIRFALDVVGGKWKLAIICTLAEHPGARFNQVRRKVEGITNVMLAQSLKEMEAHSVVHREQFNEVPPRVEYTLTEKGRTLIPVLDYLAAWGRENMPLDTARDFRCLSCRN